MDYSNYKYLLTNNNLIISSKIRNRIQFRPPLGKYNKEINKLVLRLAKDEGADPPIGLIDIKIKELLSKDFPKLEFIPDRNYFDYVYKSSDLFQLPGSAYSKIRNRLNKFKNNWSYSIENITKENIKEIDKFLHRWCLWKDCESDPLLEAEKKAILYSMENFFNLNLSGIALRIEKNIEAISIYEKINQDTAVIHYEKASPDFDGIYKAINQETAKILQNNFKFINRESDMGIEGLRKAKKSYRPHHMVEVYHIHKKNLIF